MLRIGLIVGAVVLVAAMAGYFWWNQPGVQVQTAEVTSEAIAEYVDEQAKTRLPREYLVTMPFAARIQEIHLEEGSPVKVGEVVAEISQEDMKFEVAEAEAAVKRLEASIRENNDTSMEDQMVASVAETVKAAAKRSEASKARNQVAETTFGRIAKAFRDSAASQQNYDEANLDFIESTLTYAQDTLIEESLKAMYAAARAYVDDFKLKGDVLEQEKAEAVARLEQTLRRQELSKIVSPIDGVVLERPVVNERYLGAGETLLKLGDLKQMQVEVEVLTQEAVDIQNGDRVEIYGSAVRREAGNGIAGTVVRINPAGFTKTSSLGVEQQRVLVIVDFAKEELTEILDDVDLGVGYRVQARIYTNEKSNALTIPRSGIFRGPDGGYQVFAVRGGVAKLVNVEVGLMNDRRVEITKGLEAGEKVILAPESDLADGVKVQG